MKVIRNNPVKTYEMYAITDNWLLRIPESGALTHGSNLTADVSDTTHRESNLRLDKWG